MAMTKSVEIAWVEKNQTGCTLMSTTGILGMTGRRKCLIFWTFLNLVMAIDTSERGDYISCRPASARHTSSFAVCLEIEDQH